LKAGDEDAFRAIYERFAPGLVSYAGARLLRLEDARDIVQDIFVKLWKDRQTMGVHTNLDGYLYAATRNKVIDHIRKNAVQAEYAVFLQHLGAGAATDPEAELAAKELHHR